MGTTKGTITHTHRHTAAVTAKPSSCAAACERMKCRELRERVRHVRGSKEGAFVVLKEELAALVDEL